MYLAFHRAVHPAGFTPARQHDTKTKQQPADYCIWARPHDFGFHAQLYVAENTDCADAHPEDDRLCHMGASGDPQIAEGGGEADLRALDQQTKTHAEQHRQTQLRLVHGGQQRPANHADKHQHAEAETTARLIRLLRQRRRSGDFLHLDRNAEYWQQGESRAKPGTNGGCQGKEPGVQRELRNTGKECRQVAAHRHTRAEPGDDPAQHRLHDADATARHA
ncbi:hypothetical protein SDC9_178617 [bioreactor metagenome]|uniref:Uncharacterized protein n=1 Tax=bioreactor metagenome TaxID=1076179 RepID=A0A645H5M0_9ZZZZ